MALPKKSGDDDDDENEVSVTCQSQMMTILSLLSSHSSRDKGESTHCSRASSKTECYYVSSKTECNHESLLPTANRTVFHFFCIGTFKGPVKPIASRAIG